MGKLDEYRKIVQQVLHTYVVNRQANEDEVELQTLFDTIHDHYQLVFVGWDDHRRVYGSVVHIDIKDGKIWIQRDHTEVGIANQLVAAGAPKTDIVLGFQAPAKRPLTEYAVG